MVALASATTACTTHCATRGPRRCVSTSRQLVACFGSPRETRNARRMCVCMCVSIHYIHSPPVSSSTPVHWQFLHKTELSAPHPPHSVPLLPHSDLPTWKYLRCVSIIQRQNETYSTPAALSQSESFILLCLKKQTSWHVQTFLVSLLKINVFCEPSCPALFPPWLCDKLA